MPHFGPRSLRVRESTTCSPPSPQATLSGRNCCNCKVNDVRGCSELSSFSCSGIRLREGPRHPGDPRLKPAASYTISDNALILHHFWGRGLDSSGFRPWSKGRRLDASEVDAEKLQTRWGNEKT